MSSIPQGILGCENTIIFDPDITLRVNDVPREIHIAFFDWNWPQRKFIIDGQPFLARFSLDLKDSWWAGPGNVRTGLSFIIDRN